MAYLYGDSTESGLELNYIELLRDFLDFAAQVMMSEHRIASLRSGADQAVSDAEHDLDSLKDLNDKIESTLEGAIGGDLQSVTGRCAAEVRELAAEAVRRAASKVKSGAADDQRNVTAKTQRERAGNLKLLERLLLKQKLPEQTSHIDLRLDEDRQAYRALASGRAPIGLEWRFAIDIPGAHSFARPLRVADAVGEVEVQIPEKSGLMRKSTRLRAQKLGGKYIVEVSRAFDQTTIKLRLQPHHDESGFDLTISPTRPRVRLTRIQKGAEPSPPFEPLDADADRLLELATRLDTELAGLEDGRCNLLEARLDKKPLKEHPDPTVVVQRLVERIAPVIVEISKHSLAPGELVLKRVLADDRREEIFASKADLIAVLRTVPESHRSIFSPLGLGDLSSFGDDDATNEVVMSSTDAGFETSVRSGSIGPADAVDDDEQTEVASRPQPPRPPPSPSTAPSRPKPPAPPPARTGPAEEDSIDVALAELESEAVEESG